MAIEEIRLRGPNLKCVPTKAQPATTQTLSQTTLHGLDTQRPKPVTKASSGKPDSDIINSIVKRSAAKWRITHRAGEGLEGNKKALLVVCSEAAGDADENTHRPERNGRRAAAISG